MKKMFPPSSIMRWKSRLRTASFCSADSPNRSMNASGSATNASRSAFLFRVIARLFNGRPSRERRPSKTIVPGISVVSAGGPVASSAIDRAPFLHPLGYGVGLRSGLVESCHEPREQGAGVVLVDRLPVRVREEADLVNDRFDVIEVVAGFRVHRRAAARALG